MDINMLDINKEVRHVKSIEDIKKLSNRHIQLERLTNQLRSDLSKLDRYWPDDKEFEKVTGSLKIKTFLRWQNTAEINLTADEVEDILKDTYKAKIEKHENEMQEIQNKLGVVTMTKDDLEF